jgi:Pectate lyase superfamily protein
LALLSFTRQKFQKYSPKGGILVSNHQTFGAAHETASVSGLSNNNSLTSLWTDPTLQALTQITEGVGGGLSPLTSSHHYDLTVPEDFSILDSFNSFETSTSVSTAAIASLDSLTGWSDVSSPLAGIAADDSLSAGDVLLGSTPANNRQLVPVSAQAASTRNQYDLALGLQNDTANNNRTNNDLITTDPTVTGKLTGDKSKVRIFASFGGAFARSPLDVSANVTAGGSFSFDLARLEQIFGGTITPGKYTLRLEAIDRTTQQVRDTASLTFTLQNLPDFKVPIQTTSVFLPTGHGMINVKDFGAKGNGVTDDTAAIQAALSQGRVAGVDYFGRPKAIFFPAGTYLVSDTLKWIGSSVTLQGAGNGLSVIRLIDNAEGYDNLNAPKALIRTPGGNASFRQNIWNLGIEIGSGNPGAIGLDYISNNIGSIRGVSITSEDGLGYSGLSLTRSWPGPSLIEDLQVDGFNYGIHVGQTEYSQTYQNITLSNQRVAGIFNNGNYLSIDGLKSFNAVPVIESLATSGSVVLLNGRFQGGYSALSAIENRGSLYVRNTTASGYASVIQDGNNRIPGNSVTEFTADPSKSLFTTNNKTSLNLPVLETPTYEDKDPSKWGKFEPVRYGSMAGLQGLLNSGKSTIYFPEGVYLSGPVVIEVPATVNRIVGFSSVINAGSEGGLTFRVVGNSNKPLIIEQFGYGVAVEHDSARTLVLKGGRYKYTDTPKSGNLFLEDVGMGALRINYPHSVWARQLNIESLGNANVPKIINNGGTLWIMGLKTEGKATVINTMNGGKTELLGGLIYPVQQFTNQEKTRPAFISNNSSMSLIYSLRSYDQSRNYTIAVQETRNGITRNLLTKDSGKVMPLFVGF